MVDLPTIQGAMATVFIATYILACEEERKSSSRRPPKLVATEDKAVLGES